MSTNNEQTNTYDRRAFGAGIIANISYLRSVSTDERQSIRRLGGHTNSNFFNSKEGSLKTGNNYLSGGAIMELMKEYTREENFLKWGAVLV